MYLKIKNPSVVCIFTLALKVLTYYNKVKKIRFNHLNDVYWSGPLLILNRLSPYKVRISYIIIKLLW